MLLTVVIAVTVKVVIALITDAIPVQVNPLLRVIGESITMVVITIVIAVRVDLVWQAIAIQIRRGYDNRQEQGSGTNERDSDDFPDHTPPEVSYLEWDIARPSLSGMAYDAGIGLKRVWIENDAGDECEAVILYAGHFMIECPQLNVEIDWRLRAVDEKGNLTRLIIRAVNEQDPHAD